MILNNYQLASEAARAMIESLLREMRHYPQNIFRIALSGGSTPAMLFDVWANEFADLTPWERLHFYWVDERCVPSTSLESNYGMAKRLLFDVVGVEKSHIHPINGDCNYGEEAKRYSLLVKSEVPRESGVPVFDIVFLGIGNDGHTSSIFPGQESLLSADDPYVCTLSPKGQERIAMTGKPMIRAIHTWFFVTGKEKINILREVSNKQNIDKYPASYVLWHARGAEFFTAL